MTERQTPTDLWPESDAVKPGEKMLRSLLDKPLDQLTEEDISQLTREDCRRYLKEKGMRRPSWNKSQAIQQVLSLKSLLETTTDSSSGVRRNVVSRTENPVDVPVTSTASIKVTSSDFQIPVSVEDSILYRRKDPPKPAFSGDVSCRLPVTDSNTISPRHLWDLEDRITSVTNGPVGQMTIFYRGKVNVYDSMPADKARTIMQLAANPIYLPQDAPPGGTTTIQNFPCRIQAASARPGSSCPAASSPTLQTAKVAENSVRCREEGNMSREVQTEGPGSRQASLQRYLEKRKDRGRFKSKREIDGSSSSSLEMYLNHQVGTQMGSQAKAVHALHSDPDCLPRQPNVARLRTRPKMLISLLNSMIMMTRRLDHGGTGTMSVMPF